MTEKQYLFVCKRVCEHIMHDYAKKKLAAPEPTESGYYWCKTLHNMKWGIWDYHQPTDMWTPIGGDYGETTADAGIIAWRGPLVAPND